MTLYKNTLYKHALRNVLYVIIIALYKVHSTRNNVALQNYTLQITSYVAHSTYYTLHGIITLYKATLYEIHSTWILTLYKVTLYKLPPTKCTLRKTLYTE